MDNSKRRIIGSEVKAPIFDLPLQDPKGTKFQFETSNSVFKIDRAKAFLQLELKAAQPNEVESNFIQLIRDAIASVTYLEFFIPSVQVVLNEELRAVRVCVCKVIVNGQPKYCLFTLLENFGGKIGTKSIFSKVNHAGLLFEPVSENMATVMQNLLSNYYYFCNPGAGFGGFRSEIYSDYLVINDYDIQPYDFENFQLLFDQISKVVGRQLFLIDRDSDDEEKIILRLNNPFSMF